MATPEPPTRALLIANRHSRQGGQDLDVIVGLLEEHGFAIDARPVERPAEIGDLVRAAAGAVDLVILAGGDGTMNAAADALVETGLPLAILPCGTGNDLARTLGIPTTIPEALAVIIAGRRRAIDLGRINGKHFFNVASIGLSAELIRHHTVERKRRLWLFAYLLSVRDAWRQSRPFSALLRCNGQTRRVRAMQIAIGNGRHYGGGMTVAEDAAIDDGRLDVYCLAPLTFWRLLALFPALRRGRLGRRRDALILRCAEIELITRRPMPVNTDGELTTRTPARIEVVPRALEVVVPAEETAKEETIDHAA